MKRLDVLQEAGTVISGDRDVQYGTPEQNFGRIAALWSAYLETPVLPYDVAAMMALLKIARLSVSPGNEDHWIDIAGYAACGAEVVLK